MCKPFWLSSGHRPSQFIVPICSKWLQACVVAAMKLFRGFRDVAQTEEVGLMAPRTIPSADSDSESLDESVCHSRHVDPSEADIYLDAMFGPLFYRFERIQKEQNGSPRWSDYRMVSIFLLLNVALQLTIAFKINQVTDETYGDVGKALFNGACWRLSSTGQDYIGLLYPESSAVKDPSNNDFDCVQPLLTLSMFPAELDLNHDGFWTVDDAMEMSRKLTKRGSNMASNFTNVLERMAKLDLKRPLSRSTENPPRVDMEFFRQNKGRLQMCLPVDPHLCGNLEIQGKLKKILPDLKHGDERVDTCVDNFYSFCLKLLGGNYKWIHHTTSKLCGEKTFSLKHGINVVSYETVSVYRGQTDSILGTAFVSFLMLMLFLWGMLMVTEFRAIYNFAFVVWKTPSTSNADANFAKIEDSKMLVLQIPVAHKYFALFCIALPRFLIGLVILVVGTNFLTSTNNLLDLVLNSTALSFLVEVDEMIHASMLGEGFERSVTDQCNVIRVFSEIRGTWQPYALLVFAGLVTAGWTAYAYFNPNGLKAIGDGMQCLCHFEGNCWAPSLI
eukprot:s996_g5.t1